MRRSLLALVIVVAFVGGGILSCGRPGSVPAALTSGGTRGIGLILQADEGERNTGTEPLGVAFIFSKPGFEPKPR